MHSPIVRPSEGIYGVAPITPLVRNIYLAFLSLFALVVFFGPMIVGEGLSSWTLAGLGLSNLVVVGLLAVPFLRNDWREGWLNPLVLFSAVTFVNVLAKRSGLMLLGLHEHEIIYKEADQLTLLVVYDHFLEALSMVMIYAGYLVFKNIGVPRIAAQRKVAVLPIALVVIAISFVSLVIYVDFSGSFIDHVQNLALNRASKQFITEDIGWLGVLATIGMQAHLGLLFLLAFRPKITLNPIFYILLFTALGVILISTGKRSSIIYPLVMMGLVWTGVNGKLPYIRALLGIAVCIFLVGFLGAVRGQLMSEKLGQNLREQQEGGPLVTMRHALDEMSIRVGSYSSRLSILESVPHDVPLQYGYTYLGWVARPIPRAIWPGKPTGTDSYVARTFFGVNWGIPAGGVGEAYWNFHIPGVLVVFFVFGVFKRWWRNLFIENPGNPGLLVLYVLTMFIMGAPSDTQFTQWLFAMGPALVILYLLGGLRFSGRGRLGPLQ